MKTRTVEESNYKSIWLPSGKTIRIAIDPTKPITELEYPEFYDVKITANCAGKCPWCYQDSNDSDAHYENVVEKLKKFFNSIPKEHLPYQIAYGGGEPTLHPEFYDVMRMTKEDYDILPNYTTNGMWTEKDVATIGDIITATKKYCGGVAVSCHPHLKKYWEIAAENYVANKIRLNFHNIISDKESIDEFISIFKKWKDKVEYFVLLPYIPFGRAEKKEVDWDYLVSVFPKEDSDQIAFGANFYPYLQRGELDIKVSLYEPEIMSKYVTIEDDGYMFPSSFSHELIKKGFLK